MLHSVTHISCLGSSVLWRSILSTNWTCGLNPTHHHFTTYTRVIETPIRNEKKPIRQSNQNQKCTEGAFLSHKSTTLTVTGLRQHQEHEGHVTHSSRPWSYADAGRHSSTNADRVQSTCCEISPELDRGSLIALVLTEQHFAPERLFLTLSGRWTPNSKPCRSAAHSTTEWWCSTFHTDQTTERRPTWQGKVNQSLNFGRHSFLRWTPNSSWMSAASQQGKGNHEGSCNRIVHAEKLRRNDNICKFWTLPYPHERCTVQIEILLTRRCKKMHAWQAMKRGKWRRDCELIHMPKIVTSNSPSARLHAQSNTTASQSLLRLL